MPVIIRKKDMALWLDCTRDESGQEVLPFLNPIEPEEIELVRGRFEGKVFVSGAS